jgi:hypothetical protein
MALADWEGFAERELAERLCVIVPTRGRSIEARRLVMAWAETGASCTLYLGMDDDDRSYDLSTFTAMAQEWEVDLRIAHYPRTSMNGTLNRIAVEAAQEFAFIGFMGDDHVPRTQHWDRQLIKALIRPCAIVYGNDLMQGANLPTAVFLDSRIVSTLGYIAPPELKHLFLDNAWKTWGEYLDTLTYLPDVIIEHMHPQAGKAEWDEGHARVNSGEMWNHDRQAWNHYAADRLHEDIAKLAAVAAGAPL